jgi:alginate O-acetyltransferase complex protein AlgI
VIGLLTLLLPRSLVLGRLVLEGPWAGRALALRLASVVVLPLAAITVAAGSFSPFLYFRF